jgi:hypothetical protein
MFVQLMMDIDLILPLLKSAKTRNDLVPIACISDQVAATVPDFLEALSYLRIEFEITRHDEIISGKRPRLRKIDAVVSASESTANPHRAAHNLTSRANAEGLRTYTIQHGFENVGITYFDDVHNPDNIRFASHRVFTWCPTDRLHCDVPEETRRKCLAAGCCKDTVMNLHDLVRPGSNKRLVGVFENLHWHRYDEDYRNCFLADLIETARNFKETTFLLKPHPAGRWLTQRYKGPLPDLENVIVANPSDPNWKAYTGPIIVGMADGVITTPSTVALDAARSGRPVAITGYDLRLKNYEPLPVLRSRKDWEGFVNQLYSPDRRKELTAVISSFLKDALVPGDACRRILDCISNDIDPLRSK